MPGMEPVWVWERVGLQRKLSAIEDAALFLLHKWPEADRGSKTHRAAQLAVLQALEEKIPVEEARAAFVAALERMQLLGAGPREPSDTLPGHVARPWAYGKNRRRKR